jgi:sugar porter (SP) family MFS transporter
MAFKPWRALPGKSVLLFLNLFSAVALIYEGYNQGVYGAVSGTPAFIDMAKIGANGVVTNSTKQGGLAAAYYFGAIWGAFIGGHLGDKYGRKAGAFMGAVASLIGSALQAGSVDANMFICARVIAGLGIGFVNVLIPSWVSELSEAHDRGSTFSLVFVSNFLGIFIANWINFGIRNSGLEFRWRFPLGFMCIPMLIVLITIFFLPESPRWLMANHRKEEAIEILCKIRGDKDVNDPAVREELEQLEAIVEASHHKRNKYINITLGGRYSGKLHLGRRAVLGLALQQIQQWTGILVMVSWAAKLFELAGFSAYKASWLSGLLNTFGVIGTAAAALVIDRLGRRKSLQISFAIQGVSLFLVAALIKTSQDRLVSDPNFSQTLGTAGSAFTFTFVFFFCMFNIVPCWIYGTEIWPQEVRAKGYSYTILGWAIGCGTTTFVIPIMLANIGWWSFIFFGCMNFVVMPIIHFFYPETARRSLEEVDLLFASDSLLASKNMAEHDRRVDEAGGNVAVAARRLLDEVNGETHLDPRRVSVTGEFGEGKAPSDMEHSEVSANGEKQI